MPEEPAPQPKAEQPAASKPKVEKPAASKPKAEKPAATPSAPSEPKPQLGTPSRPTPQVLNSAASWGPSPLQNMLLGFGLVGLNVVTQTDLGTLFQKLWTAPKSAADANKSVSFAGGSLLTLAGEAGFVLFLSFISGFSPTVARGVFFFWLGLYLVWLVFNGQKLGLLGATLQQLAPSPPVSAQLNSVGKKAAS